MTKPSQPKTALVIAHESDGPGGQVSVRLRALGFEITDHVINHVYDKPNEHTPLPDFEAFDIIVVMGSIRSLTKTDEIDEWVFDELEKIREAHARNQPMLGVCFGGQLLAKALGGSVEAAPVTELGWYEISDGDEPNPVGPGPWMEWHHDRFAPPPGATVLARTTDAEQLFTIGSSAGTQFHPEIDTAHLAGWLEVADAEYLAAYDQTPEGLRSAMAANDDRNAQQCHQLVDWFLNDVAGIPVDELVAAGVSPTTDLPTTDLPTTDLTTNRSGAHPA